MNGTKYKIGAVVKFHTDFADFVQTEGSIARIVDDDGTDYHLEWVHNHHSEDPLPVEWAYSNLHEYAKLHAPDPIGDPFHGL